jgi:plasmid stabilization system protein ParE
MKRVDVRPEAEVDVIEVAWWYEGEREGLGRDFCFEVESTVERIAANPLQYRERELGTRMAMVDRFPYGVYFIDEVEQITVLGILHLQRHPDSWRKRR